MKLSAQAISRKAFTLIEMIGVLAVIGILAALVVPKIFEAINNARINSAAVSLASVKTAIADHFAKFGSLVSSNGVATLSTSAGTNYDAMLLNEGFLDKLFHVQIATPANTLVVLTNCNAYNAAVATTDPSFDLATTNALNTAVGTALVEVALNNVLEADAKGLNDIIDGAPLGTPIGSVTGDSFGRVKYSAAAGGIVNMRIYLTHR